MCSPTSPIRSARPSARPSARAARPRRVATLLSLLLLVVGAAPATAQGGSSAWIDAAYAQAEQPFTRRATAGVIAVGARAALRGVDFTAYGLLSAAADSAGAAQANLWLSYQLPFARFTRTELHMDATAFGLASSGMPDSRRGGNAANGARQHVQGTLGPVAIGAYGGYASGRSRRTLEITPEPRRIVDTERFRGSQVEGGAWAGNRHFDASLGVQRWRSDDYQIMEASGFGLASPSSAYDLRDVTLAGALRYGRGEVRLSKSWRRGLVATVGRAESYTITGALRVTSRVTVYGSSGEQLADLLHGLPTAKVALVALRVQFGARTPSSNATSRVRDAEAVLDGGAGGTSSLLVRIEAREGDTVEVAGTHNDWTPVRLTHDGVAHVARLVLPTGTHRIAVRVNGGAWRAPRGLAPVRDDFGGAAGLVVVP